MSRLFQPVMTSLVSVLYPRLVKKFRSVPTRSGPYAFISIIDPTTKKKQLVEILRRLRYGRDGKMGGTGANADNDEFKVIIRGDQNIGYRSVAPVLQSCTEAAVKIVRPIRNTRRWPIRSPRPAALCHSVLARGARHRISSAG